MDEAADEGEPELGGRGPCNGLKRARRLRLQHLGEERALPGRGGVETPVLCPGAVGPLLGSRSGAVGGGGSGNEGWGLPASTGAPIVSSTGAAGLASVVGRRGGLAGCCVEVVDVGVACDPGIVPEDGAVVDVPGETGAAGLVVVIGGGRGVASCCAEVVDVGVACDPGMAPGDEVVVAVPGEVGPP